MADALGSRLTAVVQRSAGRLLEVTAPIVERWGRISAGPEPVAATALVHGLTVVTRNEADLIDRGVPVVNPWADLQPRR